MDESAGKISLSDHFTTGRLLRFAFPSIIMMIFTSIYDVVDGFFISNYVGKTEFAACCFIWPVIMVFGAVGFMIGTGGSALVGMLLGQKNGEKACAVFSMLVYVSIGAGVVLTAAGQALLQPAAILLGASSDMLGPAIVYGRIVLLGTPVVLLESEFHSFFVTAGKPQMGLWVTVAAGITNMLLDALFVGAWSMGVTGAAWATVLSECVSAAVPLIYFSRKNDSLLSLGRMSREWGLLLKAMGNGTSEFVTNIAISVVSMLYNAQLMKYAGENGVAAFGVLMYVAMIFMGVYFGYALGTSPVISFHYGSGDREEVDSLLKRSLQILGIFAIGMLLAGEVLARPLAGIFVGYDQDLLALTVRGFRLYSFAFLFASIPIFGSAFFTALNDGVTSALISLLRTVVIETGAVLILPLWLGTDGIWLSQAAAELIAAAVTIVLWRRKAF